MEVGSYKFITLKLTEHDAWMLENILTTVEPMLDKDSSGERPFHDFNKKLLTDLSKEFVRKI
jgi:hypothetical protein